MKAKLRHLLTGMLFLFLLTTAQYASAFYDPTIGKWVSRDPIGERGGENLYGFVSNDPADQIDENGLRPLIFQNKFADGFTANGLVNPKIVLDNGWALFQVDPNFVGAAQFAGLITAATVEGIGATVLAGAPEPTSKVGAAILYGKAADHLTAAFTDKGLAQRGLERLYGADNPYIPYSLLVYELGTSPLTTGANLPTSVRNVQVNDLIRNLKWKPDCAAKVRPHGELIKDFTQSPQNWERIKSQVSQTTRKGQEGGVNIESIWRNKQTGETLPTHEAFGPSGKSLHLENLSPNLPGGGAIRPYSKIEP